MKGCEDILETESNWCSDQLAIPSSDSVMEEKPKYLHKVLVGHEEGFSKVTGMPTPRKKINILILFQNRHFHHTRHTKCLQRNQDTVIVSFHSLLLDFITSFGGRQKLSGLNLDSSDMHRKPRIGMWSKGNCSHLAFRHKGNNTDPGELGDVKTLRNKGTGQP
jgi:hypothetical protein